MCAYCAYMRLTLLLFMSSTFAQINNIFFLQNTINVETQEKILECELNNMDAVQTKKCRQI